MPDPLPPVGPLPVAPGAAGPRASLARGGSLIAPALTALNLVGYVLTVTAARAFDQDAYGRLGAFLGVVLVVSVPALAVQTVVARSVARRPHGEPKGARERALLERAAVIGTVGSVVVAAASPLLAGFLHTGVAGPLWVAAQVAPLTVLSGAMGVLQGHERFRALAVVIGLQAVGKTLGLLPLLTGGDVTDVLAALTVGTAAAAVAALVLAGVGPRASLAGPLPSLVQLRQAATSLLTVLVLANIDVLLARNLLSGDDSGRYSAGSVLAKVAFWLPQAVAVVIFPRLTEADGGRELLRKAMGLVALLGLVELLGCVLLARPVLELTFGASYGSLDTIAPLWVLQGVALSIVQLLVYRAIATGDPVPGRLVAGAAVLEAGCLLVVHPTGPRAVIAIAAGLVTVLLATLLIRSTRADQRVR